MKQLSMAVLFCLLAGCVHLSQRANFPEWNAEKNLLEQWQFEGRLVISDGQENGSGHISWEQKGEMFSIGLRAPVSGQSWRLSGDENHSQLEGVKPTPVTGDSAEELLRNEIGWNLPLGPLKLWLQGRAGNAEIAVLVDKAGWPLSFDEAGWHIEFRDWHRHLTPPMPKRIIANNGNFQVRLAIQQWKLAHNADPSEPMR